MESHFDKGDEVLIQPRTWMKMRCAVKAASHQGHAVTAITRSVETSKSADRTDISGHSKRDGVMQWFLTVRGFLRGQADGNALKLDYDNGLITINWGSPGGSDHKDSACNVGDLGSVPGSGRSLGEGNDYPFQGSLVWRIP